MNAIVKIVSYVNLLKERIKRVIVTNVSTVSEYTSLMLYYRTKCVYCSSSRTNSKGYYQRKCKSCSPMEFIQIKRLLCKDCYKTFSILPWFIPPHRSYYWFIQEKVIKLFVTNKMSLKEIYSLINVPVLTSKRWLLSLADRFDVHYRCLLSTPELDAPSCGAIIDPFWSGILEKYDLKTIMHIIHLNKISIP